MIRDRAAAEPRLEPDLDRDRRAAEQAGVRLTGLIAATRQTRLLSAESENGPVVLKTATGATTSDPAGRRLFLREGRLGLRLRHPHLVETLRYGTGWILLRDAGSAGGDAQNLLDHLSRAGPLEAVAVQRLVAEVADALAYMHAKGIVHRDVKPGNILVTAAGQAILIDLGAAGPAPERGRDRDEIVGSPAWMAPEQVFGDCAGPGADVWSLALVALFMLGGRKLFEGTADRVLEHRRAGEAAPRILVRAAIDRAAAPLRMLLEAALSNDPRSRPPARAFAQPSGTSARAAATATGL